MCVCALARAYYVAIQFQSSETFWPKTRKWFGIMWRHFQQPAYDMVYGAMTLPWNGSVMIAFHGWRMCANYHYRHRWFTSVSIHEQYRQSSHRVCSYTFTWLWFFFFLCVAVVVLVASLFPCYLWRINMNLYSERDRFIKYVLMLSTSVRHHKTRKVMEKLFAKQWPCTHYKRTRSRSI